MRLGPDWEPLAGTFVKEVEAWAVDEPRGGFQPNVNVLVQEFPGASPEDYIHFSEEGAPNVDGDFEVVELEDGSHGVRVEYSLPNGLTSIGIAITQRHLAALATLTAPSKDIASLRHDLEPYLRSLRFASPTTSTTIP